jgi:predicted KAP-like P-loop ATPase
MTISNSQLIERLKLLPPNRVAEVVDFVEFLAQREERLEASQRLGDKLAQLDALNLPPVSQDDIAAEVQATRAARRALHNS